MDTMVFFFHRLDGTTNDRFRRHYLERHAPFSLSLIERIHHYSVNLVDLDRARPIGDDPDPLDAVTIFDTQDAMKFFDPSWTFRSPADAEAQMDDHNSFIGRMYGYVAHNSERGTAHLAGDLTGQRGAGAKLIVFDRDGSADSTVTDAPGVARSVVHDLAAALVPGSPPMARVIELWGDEHEPLAAAAGTLPWLTVDEHLFRA